MLESVVLRDGLRDSPRPNAMRGRLSICCLGNSSLLGGFEEFDDREKGKREKRRDDRLGFDSAIVGAEEVSGVGGTSPLRLFRPNEKDFLLVDSVETRGSDVGVAALLSLGIGRDMLTGGNFLFFLIGFSALESSVSVLVRDTLPPSNEARFRKPNFSVKPDRVDDRL
jgi:hypothetical protein